MQRLLAALFSRESYLRHAACDGLLKGFFFVIEACWWWTKSILQHSVYLVLRLIARLRTSQAGGVVCARFFAQHLFHAFRAYERASQPTKLEDDWSK